LGVIQGIFILAKTSGVFLKRIDIWYFWKNSIYVNTRDVLHTSSSERYCSILNCRYYYIFCNKSGHKDNRK